MTVLLRVILGASVVGCVPVVHAQPVVTASARIRLVRVESNKVDYVGTFMRLSGDTLTLSDELAVVRTIPVTGYRVETGGGRHRHIGAGALIGTGVGLAVGLVWRANLRSEPCVLSDVNGKCLLPPLEDAARTGAILISVGGGMLLGTIVGLIPHERWTAAVLQPQVSLLPTRGGWSVGVRLTY